MNHTFNGNCQACKIPNDKYYKECFWAAIDFIRWDELIAMFCIYFFPIGVLHWWGLPISIMLHCSLFSMNGGAVGDITGEYYEPLEEYKSEYSKEFDYQYNKKFPHWWNRI